MFLNANFLLLFAGIISYNSATVLAQSATTLQSGSISSSWQKVANASPNQQMSISLYMNAPDRPGLDARMQAISKDGTLPWLNATTLAPYITPSNATQQAVINALTNAGVPAANLTWSSLKDRLVVNATAATMAKFFNTSMALWSNSGQDPVVKAQNVTLPASIANAVYSVGTLLSFGDYVTTTEAAKDAPEISTTASRRRRRDIRRMDIRDETDLFQRGFPSRDLKARGINDTTPPASCMTKSGNTYAFPTCLMDYYGLPNNLKKSLTRRNDLALVGYLAENVSNADLQQAMKLFRGDQPNAGSYTMYLNNLMGAVNDGSNPTMEATLDSQVAVGLTYPLVTSYYNVGTGDAQTPGRDTGDIFLSTFQEMIEQPASVRPSVMAISYGIVDEAGMMATKDAMCNAAQILTALGTTIIFSSGDSGPDGVARVFSPKYPDNSGYCPAFRVGYPSGCPYILSVGAVGGWGPNEEPVRWGIPSGLAGKQWYWASGSGVSNLWATPSWQTSALNGYLNRTDALYSNKTNGIFARKGRAFPDLVGLGLDYPIILNGKAYLQAGTSMSAPVMGSIFALLNALRFNKKLPAVGFAQPLLYANPDAFRDVTKGGSWWKCGPGTADTAQTYGFNSTPGWDVASGLGTPDFAKLKALYKVA